MTFYLDKDNKVFFIKLNTETSTQEYNNLVEKITNHELPYKVIILEHDNELVIIWKKHIIYYSFNVTIN